MGTGKPQPAGVKIAEAGAIKGVGVLEDHQFEREPRDSLVPRLVPTAKLSDVVDVAIERARFGVVGGQVRQNPVRGAGAMTRIFAVINAPNVVEIGGPAEVFALQGAGTSDGLGQRIGPEQDEGRVRNPMNAARIEPEPGLIGQVPT